MHKMRRHSEGNGGTRRLKRRILILTASIGAGHIKAAEAVAKELRRLEPEAEIQMIDFMSRKVSLIHWLMKEIYLKMLAFVPNLYDVFYKIAGGKSSGCLVRHAFALVMVPVMRRLVRRCRPDIVVCTHPFPEGAAAALRQRFGAEFQLSVVMTDYSLHSIWLYPDVDQYFLAIPPMRDGMLARGFDASRLYVTGIPVDTDLADLPSRKAVRAELHLPQNQPVILLMGGGLGLGGIEPMLKDLETISQPLTFLVVAGKNERLLARVRAYARHSKHHIKAFGYTDRVHALMRASDILVTKPGALTMSEAFALGLPMLLHDPIPGPETENAIYATRHRAALWLHPGERLAPVACELLKEQRLSAMSGAAKMLARPLAARDAAAEILRGCGGNPAGE